MSGWETPRVETPEPIVLFVNSETFRARADAQQPGAWHVDWVSGPHVGYGFTTRRSYHQCEAREELGMAVVLLDVHAGVA